jgi:sugar lactone lactonase YvrE
LDSLHGLLYYHALTARTLYRIKTSALRASRGGSNNLGAKVEKVIETAPPDAMTMASNGRLYLTDVEAGAIIAFDPKTNKLEPVITYGRLSWPDSLAWGPDGALYVTTSQIQDMARFNGGQRRSHNSVSRLQDFRSAVRA